MRKKKNIIAVALFVTVILSGCGSAIPDMTEEETHIISEYAANLLLKYDKNYEVKVVDTTAYHEEQAKKAEEARKAEEEAAKEAAKEAEEAGKNQNNGEGQSAEMQSVSSIEEFYQIPGVQIQYEGFGIYNSYPEQTQENELFFALGATDGKKLLVLNFVIKNISGAELEVNMMSFNPKFKVSVNGGPNQNALFTLLPEDLAEYAGTLGVDETVRTVLAVEIPIETSESVESIMLTLKNAEGSAQLILQ